MSTNFYALFDVCHACGDAKLRWHLGKRSSGWKFMFHGDRTPQIFGNHRLLDGVTCRRDVNSVLTIASKIIDEYGQEYTAQEFWDVVNALRDNPDQASSSPHIDTSRFWYDSNNDTYFEGEWE